MSIFGLKTTATIGDICESYCNIASKNGQKAVASETRKTME